MAQKTRAQLDALIAANLPNNVSKLITPAKHREVEEDLTDSNVNILDDVIVTSAGAGSAGKLVALGAAGKLDSSTIPAGGGGTWGSITGTLSDQTDLQTALSAKDPLNQTPRVVGDGDSTTITVADLIIDYQRTDSADLAFPNPAGIPAGKSLIVANNSAGLFNLASATTDSFWNGGPFEVNSIEVDTGQTVSLRVVNSKWRVVSKFRPVAVWGDIVGNINDQSDLISLLNDKADLDSPVFSTQIETPKIVFTGNVIEVFGAGSPEGVVTADIGSLFHRTDGGPTSSIYFKGTGTGNTGWVAVGAGGGGIGGSTGGTTNAVLVADGTGGATLKASPVIADVSGNVSGVANFNSSGVRTSAGAAVNTAVSVSGAAVNIDFTKPTTTQALAGNTTLTFTGSPIAGQFTNYEPSADGTDRTVTLPANVFEPGSTTQLANFVVPANSRLPITFLHHGSSVYTILGNLPLSTGTGLFVRQTNGVLITPNLGTPSAVNLGNGTNLPGSALTGAATASGLTMATARLLGRNTASAGAIEEISLGTNLSFSGTTLNATGGGSGEWLSEATSEIAVTGATTATISRWHRCTGTSADYALTLPAASGNANRFIGIIMGSASALTRLVTIDGNGSETIDGALTRVMWANEVAVLKCDGSNWNKVSGKSIPMIASLNLSSQQANVVTATFTKVVYNQTFSDSTSALATPMADPTTNNRINIIRAGRYLVAALVTFENLGAISPRCLGQTIINGAPGSGTQVGGAEGYGPLGGYPGISVPAPSTTLAAGDFVQTYCYQNSGFNQNLQGISGQAINFLSVSEVILW